MGKFADFILGKNKDEKGLGGTPVPAHYDGPMTQQMLIDQIVGAFEYGLETESTKRTLMFPTCFFIYLNTVDFNNRKATFLVTAKDCSAIFEEIIEEKMKSNKHYADFVNHSKEWVYQFVELSEGDIVEDESNAEEITELKNGQTFILCRIYDEKASSGGGVEFRDTDRLVTTHVDVKRTVPVKPSGMNNFAFRNVKIESNNRYAVPTKSYGNELRGAGNTYQTYSGGSTPPPFNGYSVGNTNPMQSTPPPFNGNSTTSQPLQQPPTTTSQLNPSRVPQLRASGAKFIDRESGRESSILLLRKLQSFSIGRRNSQYSDPKMQLVPLTCDDIADLHLQFMYDNVRGVYLVKSFANVSINEREVKGSASPDWMPLGNNSAILFDNGVQLTMEYTNKV